MEVSIVINGVVVAERDEFNNVILDGSMFEDVEVCNELRTMLGK